MTVQPGRNDWSALAEQSGLVSRLSPAAPLEQVVEETMRQIQGASGMGDLLPHLRGVAVALPPETPLSLEIIEQFVEPVVRTVLARWSPPPGHELSKRITRQIAEVLCDNPETSARLEMLWERLQRETRT